MTSEIRVAFIGSAGIPNRYGGFESFLEHCAPEFARHVSSVIVTCDARLYPDGQRAYGPVVREFIGIPANGFASIFHDFVAFLRVVPRSTHIVVLGVSGGPWFPLWRFLATVGGRRLIVNIDGVEWRRTKFGRAKRLMLRAFDALAQICAHTVVYDSAALAPYLRSSARGKSACIAYPGDHVKRTAAVAMNPSTALTVCRIEPENNLELLLAGVQASSIEQYTVIGNWENSDYGRGLRAKYSRDPKLMLLDPVYDADVLAVHRERCGVYIHGHSVGGTNPSLVEMLFYDCRILCYDCSFNRATAGDGAEYFSGVEELGRLLDRAPKTGTDRLAYRQRYTVERIVAEYLRVLRD